MTTILTGARANSVLTIGNYLGALLPMVRLANRRSAEDHFNIFIPDLHSIISDSRIIIGWRDVMHALDPKTGETLPDGEIGEIVITTLKKQGAPLIRYRTHDLSRIVTEPCKIPTGINENKLPLPIEAVITQIITKSRTAFATKIE